MPEGMRDGTMLVWPVGRAVEKHGKSRNPSRHN